MDEVLNKLEEAVSICKREGFNLAYGVSDNDITHVCCLGDELGMLDLKFKLGRFIEEELKNERERKRSELPQNEERS